MSGLKSMRRYRGWIAAAVLVAVAAGTFFVLRKGTAAESTVTYETEQVVLDTISVTVSGTGNLEVDGTTDVYPAVSGTVASVAVAQGSVVTTGDVLFTLDPASAKANTAKALASLRQSEQSAAQAQLQLTKANNALAALKAKSTEPSSTVSATEIAAAEGDVAVAKAQLASAQAQVTTASISYEEAQAMEDDLVVTAPCSGVVYALACSVGSSVSPGSGSSTSTSSGTTTQGMTGASTAASTSSSAPITLAPEQPLAVHLTVNEVDLPSLQVGQRADIEFDAMPDLTATGKVYEIGSEGTNSSGVVTFDVWISLDIANDALRPGMSAAATIVTDIARNTLVVSNSAVKSDGSGGYYVEVLAEGTEEPQRVAVETGLASAVKTQVLSGLSEGDVVVTQTVDSSDTSSSARQGAGGMMVPGMGGGFRGQ